MFRVGCRQVGRVSSGWGGEGCGGAATGWQDSFTRSLLDGGIDWPLSGAQDQEETCSLLRSLTRKHSPTRRRGRERASKRAGESERQWRRQGLSDKSLVGFGSARNKRSTTPARRRVCAGRPRAHAPWIQFAFCPESVNMKKSNIFGEEKRPSPSPARLGQLDCECRRTIASEKYL